LGSLVEFQSAIGVKDAMHEDLRSIHYGLTKRTIRLATHCTAEPPVLSRLWKMDPNIENPKEGIWQVRFA
jgi:hypothetical protein